MGGDVRCGLPITSTSDENVETVEETVIANRKITIRRDRNFIFLMRSYFYKCFEHESSGSKICFEIAEFSIKKNIA